MTIPVACVGIAVSAANLDNLNGFISVQRKEKTMIGVPFTGALPFDIIKDTLIQKDVITADNVIGNYTFMGQLTI